MLDKVSGILSPIFTDFQNLLLWGGGLAAIVYLIIAFLKLKGAQEQAERRDIIKWMRIIIFSFIGINLVVWFVSDYLKAKVSTAPPAKKTVQIEKQVELPINDWITIV